MLKIKEEHESLLKKNNNEAYKKGVGELVDEFPDLWGIIYDKGYQGAHQHLRVITPHKKQPNRAQTMGEVGYNMKVSHDRRIVENFFGRICVL